MVDDLTPQDAPAVSGEAAAVSDEKQGFLSTSAGKAVLIGGAVVAFLIVAGIVAFAVFTFWFAPAAIDTVEDAIRDMESATATTTAGADETAIAVEPDDVPLSSIFTFRDVFEPLLKPEPSQDPSATVDGVTGADGEAPSGMIADTLYLQDVIVVDGVSYAVVWYNNVRYQLAEGEMVSGTPWQVLSIYSGSVTMLYGDSQVTLVVGQGVSSK